MRSEVHIDGEIGIDDIATRAARAPYVRRRPEDTVLHHVVREHPETFLAEARRR